MAVTIDRGQILDKLRTTFGYTSFRPLQEEIIQAILGGQDVFVLMPTGGGKSLCYQLPALLRPGMTVVVSPLIALMKDQVDALQALGVPATFINSSLDFGEVSRRQAAVARGDVKLLYVAPERLMNPGFLQFLKSVPLVGFAIDEAHCISEWGHDFRPEYRELKRLREVFPATTLAAFTATATSRVRADILDQLGLRQAPTFQGSFNRRNLFYDVRPKQAAYEQLVAYLRTRKGASGIVYCLSRNGTEELAGRLRADGFTAVAYHAGLEADERRQRQESFARDDVRIVVATIAFGMGIDKPDVRFVVHYDVPKNLEGYYQESGRAGRDGEPSDCILFYSYGDLIKYQRFIDDKSSQLEREVAQRQLRQIADWGTSSTCRRIALLAYFDEPFEGQPDPCCDVCRTPVEEEDSTIPAQMFLSCMKRTGERFGSAYVIDVLRGSRAERILRLGHDKLSTYGIGRDRSKEDWQHIGHELLRHGYVRQAEEDFNALKVTPLGNTALFKREPIFLAAPRRARTTTAAAVAFHEPLFERLRVLRKRIADERSVPPYVIFPDRTLQQMAAELPRSRTALLSISGIGERKALDFGDTFVAAIADYVDETDAQPMPRSSPPSVPRPPRVSLNATAAKSLEWFNEGLPPAEIARVRGLAVSTVMDHLAQALEVGEPVDVGKLVAPEKRQAIEAAMAALGPSPLLKPIMERLGADYTYDEIRLVRAAAQQAGSSPPEAP